MDLATKVRPSVKKCTSLTLVTLLFRRQPVEWDFSLLTQSHELICTAERRETSDWPQSINTQGYKKKYAYFSKTKIKLQDNKACSKIMLPDTITSDYTIIAQP